MRTCELCAESVSDDDVRCPRCGFRFPPEVRADARDRTILSKHDGKSADMIKRDLSERFSMYVSYFENLDPESGRPEEFTVFVEEAVVHLHIPAVIDLGDRLKFSDKEKAVITAVSDRLLDPGSKHLMHYIQTMTLMKFSNAMHFLDENEAAMMLIEAAIHRDPNDADALFNKAKLLFFEKEYEEAKRFLSKVISKDPERQDVKYLAEMIGQLK